MEPPSPPYVRSRELLSRHDSRLLVVDMQEKLLPAIAGRKRILANCLKLARAAQVLDVPVFATEQYPRGLGGTVPELAELIDDRPDKVRFSCGEVLQWGTAAEPTDPALADRRRVVVAGIEAHVCVLQTVFDLLAAGFEVSVVADAVGSRRRLDWRIALQRLTSGGAMVTTTESVLFEWCEVAGTEEFKQISQLVKEVD